MPVRNLVEELRAGRLDPVEWMDSEKATFSNVLESWRKKDVVQLAAEDSFFARRIVDGIATMLLKQEQNGDSMPPFLEVPTTLRELEQFAREVPVLASQRAFVFFDMEAALYGLQAQGSTPDELADRLAPLYLEPLLQIIAICDAGLYAAVSDRFEFLLRARDLAVREQIGFLLTVREPAMRDATLFFLIERAEAEKAMGTVREQSRDRTVEFLQEGLDSIVRDARQHRFEKRDDNTVLAAFALLIFEAAVPLKPGYRNRLDVDVTGNRYRIRRSHEVRR